MADDSSHWSVDAAHPVPVVGAGEMLQLNGSSSAGEEWSIELGVGRTASFGRTGGGGTIELGTDERLHRVCGVIEVGADSWRITNVGGWLRIRVVSRTRHGIDSLSPGMALVVPWSAVWVEVHVGIDRYRFSVTTDRPATDRSEARRHDETSISTVAPAVLDRSSGYFRARRTLRTAVVGSRAARGADGSADRPAAEPLGSRSASDRSEDGRATARQLP
ncbi:MAG: hypothetical protein R2698_01065 [Microthrixaceae bacterium]